MSVGLFGRELMVELEIALLCYVLFSREGLNASVL